MWEFWGRILNKWNFGLAFFLSLAACKGVPPPPAQQNTQVRANDANTPTRVAPPLSGGGPNPNIPSTVPLTGSTCKAFPKPAVGGDGVMLTQVFAGLSPSNPLGMQQPPGDSSRWYMIEQGGRVSVFPNRTNVTEAERLTAIDLSNQIYSTNEAGLLGFAIDPNFASTGAIYLSYTTPRSPDPNVTSVNSQLVRYHVASDGNTLNPSGDLIFSQMMYFDFHLGGNIAFGPDTYLYYGMGFGDTANDPAEFAQDTTVWRGKMLRIDVNNPNGSIPYSIPSDNPYANGVAGSPEIWALGLRNPWRWSFDSATGTLWLGDVGQDLYEEVDIIQSGKNYGWPIYEGLEQNPNSPQAPQPGVTYVPPVIQATHSQDICITGGYVYRGRAIPSLIGTYLYGDCLAGHVYALAQDGNGVYQSRLLIDNTAGVLSFAQDNAGEIYMLGRDGKVNRLDPAGAAADANIPLTLSATGCTDPNDITQPAVGMLAYSVRVPFWSDGADKGRYLALPSGGTLTQDGNNHLQMPNGTVLVKNFADKTNSKRLETRLFMRFSDGTWGGFTYAWNDAQTDATLVPEQGNLRGLVSGGSWNYPSRSECGVCHSAAPGFTLGWDMAQINTPVTFSDGSVGNQVDALVKYGLLSAPTGVLPQLPDFQDASLPVATRARTYLHVNCGVCHQPGGRGLGTPNFLFDTPAAALGVCNQVPQYGSFGVTNAHLVTPGNAAQSVLSYRVHTTQSARMPPISSGVVDAVGAGVLDAWIASLSQCP